MMLSLVSLKTLSFVVINPLRQAIKYHNDERWGCTPGAPYKNLNATSYAMKFSCAEIEETCVVLKSDHALLFLCAV